MTAAVLMALVLAAVGGAGPQGVGLGAGAVGARGLVGFGSSVSLSADGTTALVGAPATRATAEGAAWVLVRSGTGAWTKQAKLEPGQATKSIAFGATVALSANGNTALVGGPAQSLVVHFGTVTPTAIRSAAWVFVRHGSTWTQEAKLVPDDVPLGVTSFAASVALSANGQVAMLGGPDAAWIFARLGSAWRQQGSKLAPKGSGGAAARFGETVALSADGSTALIGGSGYADNVGAAWVFGRSGHRWQQRGPVLTPRDPDGKPYFGEALALSADGSTALVGGPYDGGSATALGGGAAWAFARLGTAWRQEGAKLEPQGSGARKPDSFGSSVALSSDGKTALVGGARATPAGKAWTFTRAGTGWKQQGTPLEARGGTATAFGQSVAVSSAGKTDLVGAPEDAGGAGTVWTFSH